MTFALIPPIEEAHDLGDMAVYHAELERTVAIEKTRAAVRECGEQLIDDNGVVLCADCETPISLARLAVLPRARLCVFCQSKADGTSVSREV